MCEVWIVFVVSIVYAYVMYGICVCVYGIYGTFVVYPMCSIWGMCVCVYDVFVRYGLCLCVCVLIVCMSVCVVYGIFVVHGMCSE